MQAQIHAYIRQMKGTTKISSTEPAPLPLDLFQQSSDGLQQRNAAVRQRLGLHWLEQLRRIRLGTCLPAHLHFLKNTQEIESSSPQISSQAKRLAEIVQTTSRSDPQNSTWVVISTQRLSRELTAGDGRALPFRELFKIIAEAQHAGLVALYRKIIVEITKKKQAEVQYCVRHDVPSPILEGAYAFIESLLATIPDKKPLFVDHALLQLRFARIAETYYDAEKWGWIDDPNPEHLREKRRRQARKDHEDLTRRQKTLFKFMQTAARVSISAFIDDRDQQLKHILRCRRPFNKAWLTRLKRLTYKLLGSIYRQKSLQGQNINLIHALIELDVPDHDIDVLEQVLKFLKGMGYIRIYTEPLIPMAIELFLHSRQKIEAEPQQSSEDYEVFEAFQENRRLRELRLAALETLHALDIERERQQFIQDYFACQESGQILALIEKTLPSNSEILGRIREEALNAEEQNLSDEQRTIYEAPPGQSVVVTAGPGSGKTHTLLLRLARLIHKDHIAPHTMLALAYNREVADIQDLSVLAAT